MSEPAEQMAEQPELLPMEALPECPELVEMVRARPFVGTVVPKGRRRLQYTGKILLKELRNDSDRCSAICLALRAGMSQRLVAKRFGINTRSVANIVDAMRERGELSSVRVRVDRLLDQFVEVGLERVVDGINNGEIHPGQLSIPVLAAYDKKAQRDAGMVVGTQRTEASVTVEQVLAAHALAVAARDAQSTGSDPKALSHKAVVLLDTVVDTGSAPQRPGPDGQADEGGGGSAPTAPTTRADGLPSKFRGPKEAS